jgi:hypothetical protein
MGCLSVASFPQRYATVELGCDWSPFSLASAALARLTAGRATQAVKDRSDKSEGPEGANGGRREPPESQGAPSRSGRKSRMVCAAMSAPGK